MSETFRTGSSLAVAPHVGGTLRQRVLGQRLLHAGEVVAHQQRLSGFGEIVDLVGGIVIAFHRAFEMGHERRTFDGQIVVVFHGLLFRFLLGATGGITPYIFSTRP